MNYDQEFHAKAQAYEHSATQTNPRTASQLRAHAAGLRATHRTDCQVSEMSALDIAPTPSEPPPMAGATEADSNGSTRPDDGESEVQG